MTRSPMTLRPRRLPLAALLVVLVAAGLAMPSTAAPASAATVVIESIAETGDMPSASDNDFTRIDDAVQAAASGDVFQLVGTFDWTEFWANLAWSNGSDATFDTADDFALTLPGGLTDVTLTATALGDAVIQGPGDLPHMDLESCLLFNKTSHQGWTVSNLTILDFDLAIGMFFGAGSDAFDGVTIANNSIRLPTDTRDDAFQNIAIHLAFGSGQTITGNQIFIPGDGVSDSGNSSFAASVALQSNTSGGSVYDSLEITGNTVTVMEAPAADPEVVIGIWENSHAHDGDILVADNVFTNADPGNDPANNLQRAFRVTTHSSATGTTTYSGNTVRGANRGIEWLSGQNFAGRLPVVLTGNDLADTTEAVKVTSEGSAVLSCNRLDGTTDLLNDTTNLLDAEENWWGCNDGPGAPDCGTAPAMATVDP